MKIMRNSLIEEFRKLSGLDKNKSINEKINDVTKMPIIGHIITKPLGKDYPSKKLAVVDIFNDESGKIYVRNEWYKEHRKVPAIVHSSMVDKFIPINIDEAPIVADPETETEPDTTTPVKPKPPIAPEPNVKPKPKAEIGDQEEINLFFINRGKQLQEAPDFTHPDKQAWIDTGDDVINAMMPDLSDKEQSYLKMITSEQYDLIVAKLEKYAGLNADNFELPKLMSIGFQTLQSVIKTERAHKKDLEEMAVNLVLDQPEFAKVKEAIDEGYLTIKLSLEQPQAGDYKTPEAPEEGELSDEEEFNAMMFDTFKHLDDKAIRRRFSNLMIQGSAVNKLYLYNLIENELKMIDNKLPNQYGILGILAEIGYWATPDGIEQAAAEGSGQAGVSKITPKGEGYELSVKGLTFPYLVHELVKGIYEWFSLRKEFQGIMDKEKISDETRDMLAGPGIYRKVVNMVPVDKQELMPLIQKKLLELQPDDLKKILNGDTDMMNDIINDIERE